MLNKLPHLRFLHPRRIFHLIFTDCEATHWQGIWGCSAGPRGAARWAVLHAWRSPARSLPCLLPKGTVSSPHALFKLLALRFPTLNSFSFWTYIQVSFFSPYVIKPQRNKAKTGEWRKTMVESARRIKRSRKSLSNGCHLLVNFLKSSFY